MPRVHCPSEYCVAMSREACSAVLLSRSRTLRPRLGRVCGIGEDCRLTWPILMQDVPAPPCTCPILTSLDCRHVSDQFATPLDRSVVLFRLQVTLPAIPRAGTKAKYLLSEIGLPPTGGEFGWGPSLTVTSTILLVIRTLRRGGASTFAPIDE